MSIITGVAGVGALIAGNAADRVGRRPIILVAAAIFVVGQRNLFFGVFDSFSTSLPFGGVAIFF